MLVLSGPEPTHERPNWPLLKLNWHKFPFEICSSHFSLMAPFQLLLKLPCCLLQSSMFYIGRVSRDSYLRLGVIYYLVSGLEDDLSNLWELTRLVGALPLQPLLALQSRALPWPSGLRLLFVFWFCDERTRNLWIVLLPAPVLHVFYRQSLSSLLS